MKVKSIKQKTKGIKNDKTYVIYTDTDSCFVSADPYIMHAYPGVSDKKDDDWYIQRTLDFADIIQKHINRRYNDYVNEYHNLTGEHKLFIKQENVAKTALWINKKRYAQKLLFIEGIASNEMDVKGLDIIRSNYPRLFKKMLKDVINMILEEDSNKTVNKYILGVKKDIENVELIKLMFPTGVKKVEEYMGSPNFKGVPAHSKSAVNYNRYLHIIGKDHEYERIKDGDKIKWTYLRKNPYNMEQIAIKGFDDPPELYEFISIYIDYDKIYSTQVETKLNEYWDALKWVAPSDLDDLDDFFEFG